MQKYVFNGISALFLVVLSILSIQFSGCDESGVIEPSPTLGTISGKILNIFGEPIPNIKVSIGSDTSYSDPEGKFIFNEVTTPYTFYISYERENQYVVLPNLTTLDIRYVMDHASIQYSNPNYCNVNIMADSVLFDGISAGRFLISDQSHINVHFLASVSNYINVRMGDKSLANARIHFLGYKTENNRISQYEKFGYKDIVLTSGGIINVNFENSDVSYNPDETVISGEFINNSGYNIIQFFYLQFGEYHTPNYITQMSFERTDSENFSYVVPSNLPVPFHLLVNYHYSSSAGSGNLQKKLLPGSLNNMYPIDVAPVLISPQNGATGVTLSTPFEFNTEGDEFVYRLTIISTNGKFIIYTKNSGINLETLSYFNFAINAGQAYTWSVEKLGRFNSVNDYATESQVLERSRTSTNAPYSFTGQ